jgi:hypothetical protein
MLGGISLRDYVKNLDRNPTAISNPTRPPSRLRYWSTVGVGRNVPEDHVRSLANQIDGTGRERLFSPPLLVLPGSWASSLECQSRPAGEEAGEWDYEYRHEVAEWRWYNNFSDDVIHKVV